jgi:chemotaxis protein CheC
MSETPSFDDNLINSLKSITDAGIYNAARGFSSMLGRKIEVSKPVIKVVPLFDIPKMIGGLENEAIGIYLRAEGGLTGQIMMIIPYHKALELVDLIMGTPSGTTNQLGALERSALAEVGNMTATFFLNAIANITHSDIRPTPPAVMVDMIGAILDIIIATTGGISDQVLLLQSDFLEGGRSVETNFWVIPDAHTLNSLRPDSEQ